VGFLKVNAKPKRVGEFLVWYSDGGNDNLCDPTEGILPLEICRHLKGTQAPMPGNGGSWYLNHMEAYFALEKVINDIVSAKIRLERMP
jgi:hypothetical protein